MQRKRFSPRKGGPRSLQIESLETRALLAASPWGAGALHHAGHHLGHAAELGKPVAGTPGGHHRAGHAARVGHRGHHRDGAAGQSDPSQPQNQTETNLIANLADPTGATSITGVAHFKSEVEDGQTEIRFTVNVEGATPGATLSVAVDGTAVGTIVVDVDGNGRLALSSNPEGHSASQLPTDFPTVAAGSVVTVGTATGTLATPSDHGDQGQHSETELAATLADPSGATTVTGIAQYHSEQDDGQTETRFMVNVQGATPNDVLSVTVGTTVVGQITVDANGNGLLSFSSNPEDSNSSSLPADFPAITAGTSVSVGTASGTFVTPSDHGDGGGDSHQGDD